MQTEHAQSEINITARFFYSRANAKGIVVFTNRPETMVGQFPNDIPLYIVCNPLRILRLKKNFGSAIPNAAFITLRMCSKEFLDDKLLLCTDYFEHQSSLLGMRLRFLQKSFENSLLGLAVVPKSIDRNRLSQLLPSNKAILVGKIRKFSGSLEKDQTIILGGRLIDFKRKRFPLLPVLAIMHVYNEQDIINASVNHLLKQGVDVHIIDNWSTDKTYDYVRLFAKRSSRVTYERFPKKPSDTFELGKILKRVADVAREKNQYSWIMLNDADEIRWSPWQGMSLQQAFSFIDSLGYNAIDYTVFNFTPTKEGFDEEKNPLDFFKYGEFSGMEGHFAQVKTWKNNNEAELASSGGHHVAFSNQKIFPLKFFLGHYPIRSTRHGMEKIFKDRQSRFTKAEKQRGWHVQYSQVSRSTIFVKSSSGLLRFGTKKFWEDYILERLSGVGIKRD